MKTIIGIGELSVVFVGLFIQQIVPSYTLPLTTESTVISESRFNNNNNINNIYNAKIITSTKNDSILLPPLIFPEDNSTYPILRNTTAIKILTLTSIKNDGNETLNVPAQENAVTKQMDDNIVEDDYDYDEDEDEGEDESSHEELKKEVENIQMNHVKPGEPELEERFGDQRNLFAFGDNTVIEVTELKHGHWIAIFVGFLALSSICVYAGLIIWRQMLEKRYGMRERLVPESDSVYCSRNSEINHFVP